MAFNVGDKVHNTSQYDVYGTHLQDWVWSTSKPFEFTVMRVNGNNIYIGWGGAVTAVVPADKLTTVSQATNSPTSTDTLKRGDKVTTTAEWTYDGSTHLCSFVRTTVYDVIQVGGKNLPDDRIVIGTLNPYCVVAAVRLDTIKKVGQVETKVEETPPEPVEEVKKVTTEEMVDNIIGQLTSSSEDEVGDIANSYVQNVIDKSNQPIIDAVNIYMPTYNPNTSDFDEAVNSTTNNSSSNGGYTLTYKPSNASDYEGYYIITKPSNASDYEGYYLVARNSSAVWQSSYYQTVAYNRYNSTERLTDSVNEMLEQNDPSIIQNSQDYPKKIGFSSNMYRYNYEMNFAEDTIDGEPILLGADNSDGILRKTLNNEWIYPTQLYRKYTEYYNKFKIPNGNDSLTKTFSHVFFVRPDCNLLQPGSTPSNIILNSDVNLLSEFYYASKHCPELLMQLTQQDGKYGHQFMMYLSNKARSFQLADEYITTDTYGQALTGYKIPYGKHNVESKTAKSFSIDYIDDKDLHVYNLHKLWIDYISYVYRGKLLPDKLYMYHRVLDYPTCVYYIVCAEDGETIIFWSKYWGVFPTEAPSSSFSYSADNPGGLHTPTLQINYQYAWKEDFNPLSLVEFNTHMSNPSNKAYYYKNYNSDILGVGNTWSKEPFIETYTGSDWREDPYTFKLRFKRDTD